MNIITVLNENFDIGQIEEMICKIRKDLYIDAYDEFIGKAIGDINDKFRDYIKPV